MKNFYQWLFCAALVAGSFGTFVGYYIGERPHYFITLQIMDFADPRKETLRYGPEDYLEWAQGIMIDDIQTAQQAGVDIAEIIYIHSCDYDGVYAEEVKESKGCLHRLMSNQLPDFMLYEYDHERMRHAPVSEPVPH